MLHFPFFNTLHSHSSGRTPTAVILRPISENPALSARRHDGMFSAYVLYDADFPSAIRNSQRAESAQRAYPLLLYAFAHSTYTSVEESSEKSLTPAIATVFPSFTTAQQSPPSVLLSERSSAAGYSMPLSQIFAAVRSYSGIRSASQIKYSQITLLDLRSNIIPDFL